MDDKMIVKLFLERNEEAIKNTEAKYSRYCMHIANNILDSLRDSEECVSDAYLRLWNSIPPARPTNLKAYIGKITRNLALDAYDKRRAKKRSDATELAYEELSYCIPDITSEESVVNELTLKQAINGFLASLKKSHRIIFMQRYWYLSSVKDIAKNQAMTENNVKVILMRLREKLKKYLEKEGIKL